MMSRKTLHSYESAKFYKHLPGRHNQETHGRRHSGSEETPLKENAKPLAPILVAHQPRAEYLKFYDALLDYSAKQKGKTPEEFMAGYKAIAKNFVEGAEPWTRMSQPSLTKLLSGNGQFLSASALHKSAAPGAKGKKFDEYIAGRERYEEQAFSYEKDTKPEDRPIYGYLSKDPDGIEKKGLLRDNINSYGSVAIHFDNDVKNRTTYTAIDSLSDGGDPYMIPQPLSQPSEKAFPMWSNAERFKTLSSFGGYTEAQYHGGVKSSNIKEVVFHGTPPTKALEKLLTQQKIPYRTV